MSELHSFLNKINLIVSRQDGMQLSHALSLPLQSTMSEDLKALASRTISLDIFSYCASNIRDTGIAPAVAGFLSTLSSFYRGEFKDAFEKQMVRVI